MFSEMIKWIGKDVTDRLCWTVKAQNYQELYSKLVNLGIIEYDGLSPYAQRQLKKSGQDMESFGLTNTSQVDKITQLPDLCEEELRLLIYHCDDVAVYQEFIDKEYSAL